jgi:hypothetical protein
MKNSSSHAESMSTSYSFLDTKKNVVYSSGHQACFGQLFTNWRKHYKKSKYMSYLPGYSKTCKKATRIRWIELGQEMDILDDDVSATHIHTNGVVINMKDKDLTIGGLYLQLTFMRWLREAPVLVNNVLALVDEAGRDFWAAVQFCHATNVQRADHSLLPVRKGYSAGGNGVNIERDLGLIMRMHKTTVTPHLTDKRTVVTATTKGTGFRWQWFTHTVKPEKNLILKHKLMLLSSELHPLIYTGSVKKAEAMVKTLQKRKSFVEFQG